jgi:hypothetical protein
MNSAQEVTDAKQVIGVTGCTAISGCAQPYSRRYQVQKERLAAKYTITNVSSGATGPSPDAYITLNDGGTPQAVIVSNTLTVVNTPVYITPPPSTVTGSDGYTYFLTVSSSSCCSCSQ